ncbi:GAF domain-containing protein [Nostoc sp. ATCC 53789]|uniref:hybrid sensor histidine kinase/response regulator n=1 Tax=Nostoc sp. ATCC 53789 TaxID=76335 RepID=UPI000DEC0E70|nr:GAF domain-containing protein [Nostoc sp. ATCC 53789]QHG17607.1 GAF domain-containing protein [Nostoc sp. ATCC 53789]RCJ19112.1 histidine kinase [Nostoc sp. ATCC 53789]
MNNDEFNSMCHLTECQQAEEVLQQQIQWQRLVMAIAQRIRQSLNLDKVLNTTVTEVRQFLQVDRVFMYQFEPDYSGVVVVESVDDRWIAILNTQVQDTYLMETRGEEYRHGRIQAIADIYTAGLTECHRDLLTQFQVRANLAVPILQGKKLWGLLVANQCAAPRQWQTWEIDFLKQLAVQVGIAIQQSQLYEQVHTELAERKRVEAGLRARVRQQAAVAKLGQLALANIDLYTLMDEAVALVTQGLEVEYSKVLEMLPDENSLLLRSGVGWQPGLVGNFKLELGGVNETQASYTLLSHEPVIVCDLRKETRFQGPPLLINHSVISGMSVIIQGQKQPLGVLGAHTTRQREFTQNDIHFLQAIANVLATTIERKWAEQKIREQAALLDIASDAIIVRNFQNQILFWNQGAERLYGWEAHEALGKNLEELLCKESSQQLQVALTNVTNSGLWQGELHKVTKGGKEIIVESRWTLMRDEAEQPKSILCVDTDITEKKQLLAQFLRAQRLESLGTLASGIAHDLNNILTPILSSVEMLALKLPNLDAGNQQLLKLLDHNSKRAADLVKQIMTFSRRSEGNGISLQIEHLLLEIEQIVQSTFPKSIAIINNLPRHKLWTILADPTQIHQVLMNLCVNARDAMPKGGTLSISAENLFVDENFAKMNLNAQVGPYIVITISDTGFGISPVILERIFEPFFTTKEPGKGTGLGLSTVIGIVKNHNGFVKVSSEVSKGSQFQVYLPALNKSTKQQAENLELPNGNGELILVVDDEAAILEISKTLLEDHNYKTLTAINGIEAISLYAQHQNQISMVLMDMMMPSMDGLTAIGIMQQMNPQVKIMGISGMVTDSQIVEAANAGINIFLKKPYTFRQLLHAINDFLSEP